MSAVLKEGARVIDIDYLRKARLGDDAVLALCDEVETLRARLAAGPEVLREWPTVESAMLLKLEGPWCYVTRSSAIGDAMHVGYWTPGGRGPVFIVSREKVVQRDAFRPGEFFVRVP